MRKLFAAGATAVAVALSSLAASPANAADPIDPTPAGVYQPITAFDYGFSLREYGNGYGSLVDLSVDVALSQPNRGATSKVVFVGCGGKTLASKSVTRVGDFIMTLRGSAIPADTMGHGFKVLAVSNLAGFTETVDVTPSSLRKHITSRSYFRCAPKSTAAPKPKSYIKSWGKKSGTAKVKRTVKVRAPKLKAGAPKTKISYRWYVGSKKISKATKAKYKIPKKHKGKKLRVKVRVKTAGVKARTKTYNFGKIKK